MKEVKVSGTGADDVSEVKDEVEDMFYFLTWLDPFYKPRKTSSNFPKTIDSGNEQSDDDDVVNIGDSKSETDASSIANISQISDVDMQPSNNFRQGKKAKLQSKKARGKNNVDVTNAEIQVLNSIGEALKPQTSSINVKDEDELFGALVSSQIRQIAPERRVFVKMQISNLIYQEILSTLSAVSSNMASQPAGQTWPFQEQQPQSQNQTSLFERRNRRSPFPIPKLENSNETPYQPGQLFYQQQSRGDVGFYDDLNTSQ
jgi:hypothetical protein